MRLLTKVKVGAILFVVPLCAGFLESKSRLVELREHHQAILQERLDRAHQKIEVLEARLEKLESGASSVIAAQQESLDCMAKNIYFESGNQSYRGKLAVGSVVMNRVLSKRYPETPCEVIDQPSQFSWTKDGKSDTPDHTSRAWRESKRAAKDVLLDHARVVKPSVHHYHADYVQPPWASKMTVTATIGDHIFYE